MRSECSHFDEKRPNISYHQGSVTLRHPTSKPRSKKMLSDDSGVEHAMMLPPPLSTQANIERMKTVPYLSAPFAGSLFNSNRGSSLDGSDLTKTSSRERDTLSTHPTQLSSFDERWARTQMLRLAATARTAELAAKAAAAELEAARAQQELQLVEEAHLLLDRTHYQQRRNRMGPNSKVSLGSNTTSFNALPFLAEVASGQKGSSALHYGLSSKVPMVPSMHHGMLERRQSPSKEEMKPTNKRSHPTSCTPSCDVIFGKNDTNEKRAKKVPLPSPTSTRTSDHGPEDKSSPVKGFKKFRRPYSAYNFFMMCEREYAVNNFDAKSPAPLPALRPFREVIKTLPTGPGRKKRRHRLVHGKIGFQDLSKLMSTRWRTLPEERRNYYKSLSEMDRKRYAEEMQQEKNDATT